MNYHPGLIDFFKRHNMYDKEMFDYFMQNSYMIDYDDEDQRDLIRCNYIIRNGILTNINIYVPFVNSNLTMMMSIHEIVHAISTYKYLGKRVNDRIKKEIRDESLPLLYEIVYFEEVKDEKLERHLRYLDSKIDKTSDEEYQIALAIREKLYNNYVDDFSKMKKISKKLTRKQKRITSINH